LKALAESIILSSMDNTTEDKIVLVTIRVWGSNVLFWQAVFLHLAFLPICPLVPKNSWIPFKKKSTHHTSGTPGSRMRYPSTFFLAEHALVPYGKQAMMDMVHNYTMHAGGKSSSAAT
jgi:hypothetical protein